MWLKFSFWEEVRMMGMDSIFAQPIPFQNKHSKIFEIVLKIVSYIFQTNITYISSLLKIR